jgi:hypothetical protein
MAIMKKQNEEKLATHSLILQNKRRRMCGSSIMRIKMT